MSNNTGGFRGNRNKSQAHKKNLENVDEDNPIICAFKGYAKELDSKHDRYERIVKHSRDITIESKRIIFLLHTIGSKKNNAEKIISDAQKRLEALCHTHFLSITKGLEGLDPYQYARAYSPGLQEFVEAYTFCEFLSDKKLSSWKYLQKQFFYKVAEKENVKIDVAEEVKGADEVKSDEVEKAEEVKEEEAAKDETPRDEAPKEETKVTPEETKVKEISCLIQPMEFILGLVDVTGQCPRTAVTNRSADRSPNSPGQRLATFGNLARNFRTRISVEGFLWFFFDGFFFVFVGKLVVKKK